MNDDLDYVLNILKGLKNKGKRLSSLAVERYSELSDLIYKNGEDYSSEFYLNQDYDYKMMHLAKSLIEDANDIDCFINLFANVEDSYDLCRMYEVLFYNTEYSRRVILEGFATYNICLKHFAIDDIYNIPLWFVRYNLIALYKLRGMDFDWVFKDVNQVNCYNVYKNNYRSFMNYNGFLKKMYNEPIISEILNLIEQHENKTVIIERRPISSKSAFNSFNR